ncbi:MAG: hypothetical protein O3C63_09525 [Cyanobacteria bacterium]|nr:hypothetical protein [Cyanobacteriota bacterium]
MSEVALTPIRIQPELVTTFIKEKALNDAAQKAFKAIFDFIASTGNLDFDNLDQVKQVLDYAQSIFEARQDSTKKTYIGAYKALVRSADFNTDQQNELKELGTAFAKTVEKAATSATSIDVTDKVENQGDNSVEAMAEALKLLAPKLGMVKDALDALDLTKLATPDSDKPSEEAQFKLANILQPILKEVELAQKQGQLTNQKEISDFIGLRFIREVVNFNNLENAIKINRADINAFTDSIDTVMKTSDGTASKEEQHKMMDLILNHKGLLLGLVAMVSNPLAKMFASLPFGIGAPFNFLLAQVHSNIGPIVTAAITGSMMRPNARAPEAQAQTTQAT